MDLKQLHYFLTIVSEEQITAAAKKLHMAQPPLSHQIKLLESELGVTLFRRGPHHIELTDAGRAMAHRARQLLDLADSTRREVADFQRGIRGTLAIGTVSSSGNILFSPGLRQFHEQYQDIHFEIHDGNTYQILEMLDQSIIEIGIVRTPFNSSRFNCRFLSAEPMVAAMTREWDWCPGQDVIPVCDLAGKPLIIYRRFNQLLHDTFEAADVRPDIYCRNDDARTTVLWANAGLGVAIAPAAALNLAAHENLRVKQIDEKKLRTRLVAIWRQDRYLSTAGEKFLAALEMEEKA
ncbi:MAG: LysR family transcriptional regulator [Selenomonas sp.]|jgi:DNA-binding transcriptional LysR family regulator|nr:LysR family transcriptional regulator [Selenomonas sp.]